MQTITFAVAMGDEVRDRISGFTGIVVAVYYYFNRCQRACVQAKLKDDGTLGPAEVFDVEQLEIITVQKIAQKPDHGVNADATNRNPNGPMPNPVRVIPPSDSGGRMDGKRS